MIGEIRRVLPDPFYRGYRGTQYTSGPLARALVSGWDGLVRVVGGPDREGDLRVVPIDKEAAGFDHDVAVAPGCLTRAQESTDDSDAPPVVSVADVGLVLHSVGVGPDKATRVIALLSRLAARS